MFKQSLKKITLLYIIIVLNTFTLSFAKNKITLLPNGVSVHVLDNGLEILLIEKPALPMVGINTVVKVGSAYENFASSGMSHMLEHLLFNGTNTLTQKELYDSTDIIGGYNNANTGEYYTNYMMVAPAENIIDGMKLQSAMLFDSILPNEKFEKEKGIVLEEIAKSLASSNEQIERNILSVIFDGHALSLPTLGTYSTIKNMKRDDVFNFYKNYYVPNNMVVSVIGNFNTEEMLNSIKELYGKYEPKVVKQNTNSEFLTGFNKIKSNNVGKTFHRFYKGTKTLLQLFFEIETPNNLEAIELLQLALDVKKRKIKEELSKKYGKELKDLDFSTRATPIKNYLQATLSFSSDKKNDSIKNSFLEILYKTKLEISSQTILNESIKARTRFLKNIEKPHMFGIYNASVFAEYGIEDILSSYSGNGYFEAEEYLKKFKIPQEYITIIQHPKANNPNVKNLNERKAKLLKKQKGSAEIINKQAVGSDLLAIHYLIKNKAELEAKFGKNAAQIWHDAFGQRMNNPEVQKISNKFGFTYTVNDNPFIPMDNIYLSPEFGYIRAEGLASDIKSAIDFLNNQFLSFIPTKEEFEKAQEKSNRLSMMGMGNAAKKLFDEKLKSTLYEKLPIENEKPELTYENLIQFGKEYFVPSNMVISVVSPEKDENIKNYFSTFVGEEKFSSTNKLGDINGFRDLTAPQEIDMKGNGEQSYLYYGFQKEIQPNEVAKLKVLSLLLADEIIFDIREKQGLAYRMSAGIDVIKNKAMFYIKMGTRPENVEKLVPQFPTFFTKEFSNKVTANAIKKSVNMYLGRMMFRRLSSINQGYYLGYSQYFYGDITNDEKSLNDLKNVTVEEVKQVIEKYMEIENSIKIYIR